MVLYKYKKHGGELICINVVLEICVVRMISYIYVVIFVAKRGVGTGVKIRYGNAHIKKE
jgi:hypothetical protein